ncbi:DUF6221 family protein [Streptomyces echinoruber]|uniref:Uncharacterized protein n=1 Tax=Streptomyces echinoruber TaxID=68898 RepID=A0A918VIF0_9ACTN|nr:DUF6221 family protein [Streptomyces echinoruber]GHA01331.1 hypothetical protein GCM10010389_45850 [Streptomyces echinoruber]
MTSVDDLVRWLDEQLKEDERIARAAFWDEQSDVWTARPPQASYERYTVVDYLDDGVVAVTPENADADGVGQHVAELDPARVLREIDAKRQLLDEHQDVNDGSCGTCVDGQWGYPTHGGSSPQRYPCRTLRLLALPYADRTGYRQEWRP